MIAAINLALSGLSNSATRAANTVSNIVNASSTGQLDQSLISLQEASIDYQSDAAVIKTAEKAEKSLLDIKA